MIISCVVINFILPCVNFDATPFLNPFGYIERQQRVTKKAESKTAFITLCFIKLDIKDVEAEHEITDCCFIRAAVVVKQLDQ